VVRQSSGKKNKGGFKKGWFLILTFFLVVLLITGWVLFFEGKKPAASLDNIPSSIGSNTEIEINIKDEGRGLKDIQLYLYKNERELLLEKKEFDSVGIIKGTGIGSYRLSVKINPEKLGIKDGMASLRLFVRDSSFRSFFKGNSSYFQKEVIIDTTPPEINVLSRKHYISPGGTGLVCYKVSELDSTDGVMVGDEFFPGYSGYIKDPHYKIAFFAMDHKKEANNPIYIKAEDRAGNVNKSGFPYYLKNKSFVADRINISDNFLSWKMPQFDIDQGEYSDNLEKFLAVNNKLRKDNSTEITKSSKSPEKKIMWDGRFIQMPGSAKRAGFADHRSYYYKGKKIDEAYHMGLDLASVSNATVPASNSGKVADVKRVGIYGLTVVIDHGFGLFSCYSHLSQANVKKGDLVEKGDIIGRTGTSGLAVGDHLHFAVFVNNRFVDPIEWLDSNWIQNNISSKLELLESYK
jgi:murein DD-endopeptidase MepM/ murein hydrolase activator NlpD